MAQDQSPPPEDPPKAEEEIEFEDLLTDSQNDIILRVFGMAALGFGIALHFFLAMRELDPTHMTSFRTTHTARFTGPLCMIAGLYVAALGQWGVRPLMKGKVLSRLGWVAFIALLIATSIFRMFVYAD